MSSASGSELFSAEIEVLSEHVDRLGHTNNVRYLEWLEQIAWRHIESLGFGWQAMSDSGLALAITQTQMQYRLASYAGDKLRLETWISSNDGRLKCGRAFRLVRIGDGKTVLTAEMEFACIRLSDGRPAKMPAAMSQALETGRLS